MSSVAPDDRFAAALRGFGPLGVFAILVILAGNGIVPPVSAILVMVWASWSHTPWRDIGYVRPANWPRAVVIAVVAGIAFKLLMKSVVMPLFGANPQNQAYQHLVGNTAALPGMLYLIIAGAGFGEETVFRGYMFERLGKLLGASTAALVGIVLITTAVFGIAHYPEQGRDGVVQATIFGLVFGGIYARTRSLFALMIAHATFDLTALAIIYWNLEAAVARAFFG